ncbi:Phosphoglycerate kinase [Dissostichus eleginoides]|uniref:Phosphoglycerate kinase n=1 Tax=Dissostichus eleginoides TaxID=100907 RepID=A0AAD9EVR6_DISEL|nr:Phosphoglycerate kinase [Dissostichus eleginoides]
MLRKIQKEVFETTIPHPRDQTMVADTKIIPFITTYSSHSTVMGRQIKRNFQETMGNQFVNQPTKVISAFRRNPNLKDLLVRAKLPLLGTSVQIPQDSIKKTKMAPMAPKQLTEFQILTRTMFGCCEPTIINRPLDGRSRVQ